MNPPRLAAIAIACALLMVSCAPAEGRPISAVQAQRLTGPQRMTTVVLGDPGYFSPVAYPGQGRVAGSGDLEALLNAGLTQANGDGVRIPQLGTEVPSTLTGSWRVLPDGRMETVATLKPGAFWHDGTPVTATDLLFSVRVARDTEIGLPRHAAMEFIEGAEALDARTAVVRWSMPYIEADQVFASFARIIPEHILGTPYANRANLLDLSYWREDFVGNGPFKLRQYLPNSFALLDAFDGYIEGRPKLDVVEVKFIQDSNIVVANVLAGAMDWAPNRTVSFEQAAETADRWPDGTIVVGSGGTNISIYIQFLNPQPAALANVSFRRAVLLAMNRQALVDGLQRGQGAISHTTVLPTDTWEYPLIEKDLVKYPYDPRRATELIQGLGLAHTPDGSFVDGTGQRLSLELRTTTSEPETKMVLAIADDWRQVGVPTDTYVIPVQQASDREYRATFPGVQLLNQHTPPQNFHSAGTPLPENRYVGVNRNRIRDKELDSLIDGYQVTIPTEERMQVLGRFLHRMTDEVITMPTMYRATAILVASRVRGMVGTTSWNVHEWTVTG